MTPPAPRPGKGFAVAAGNAVGGKIFTGLRDTAARSYMKQAPQLMDSTKMAPKTKQYFNSLGAFKK
jgi:hypothetical protein